MSASVKQGPDPALENLANLAGDLAEAIAKDDVQGARQAHSEIGRGLESASEQPLAVVDLARERARRPARRRRRAR
jgi:hypothetical protein